MSRARQSQAGVDSLFIGRYSPKLYSSRSVRDLDLLSLFEAARWSPSSYNEQPWFFLYADRGEDLELYRDLLLDVNKPWASSAPVLLFMLASRHFARNGSVNSHCEFDAGAAWMSFTLQALKLGLYTRAMAGFHVDRAYEELMVPRDKYKIICGIALGYRADGEEVLSGRKDLTAIYRLGKFS